MSRIMTMLLECILLPITAVCTFFGFPPQEDFWSDPGPEIGTPGDGLYLDLPQIRPIDGTHGYLEKFRREHWP